jgi:hypothetical protein
MIRGACCVALGAVLGACISAPDESWVPQEVDVADALKHVGQRAYSMMCDELDDRVHDLYSSQLLVQAACTAHALSTTQDATACAQATSECLETLPPPVEAQLQTIREQVSCGSLPVSVSECPSPVSELVACIDDLRDRVEQTTLTVTCAAFGSPVPPDWWRVSLPTSCLDLVRRCPSASS